MVAGMLMVGGDDDDAYSSFRAHHRKKNQLWVNVFFFVSVFVRYLA